MPPGAPPSPPELGWTVHYQAALRRWLLEHPSTLLIPVAMEWIASVEALGPSPDGLADPDDRERFAASLADGLLHVSYFVVEYEQLIVVKAFTGP